jgi:hypothetical protein
VIKKAPSEQKLRVSEKLRVSKKTVSVLQKESIKVLPTHMVSYFRMVKSCVILTAIDKMQGCTIFEGLSQGDQERSCVKKQLLRMRKSSTIYRCGANIPPFSSVKQMV